MLTFSYRVEPAKNGSDRKYILWECIWDGKNDEEWQEGSEAHPFSYTADYKDSLELYRKYMEAYRRQKRPRATIHDRRKCRNTIMDHPGLTRKEIEEIHPRNIKEMSDYVVYNPATLALCKMLVDKEGIRMYCGYTVPYDYWMRLFACLFSLWD